MQRQVKQQGGDLVGRQSSQCVKGLELSPSPFHAWVIVRQEGGQSSAGWPESFRESTDGHRELVAGVEFQGRQNWSGCASRAFLRGASGGGAEGWAHQGEAVTGGLKWAERGSERFYF